MEVFIWFIEECPVLWIPALFFLFVAVMVSGCLALLLFPAMDYFLEKDGGAKLADDF